MTLCTSVQNKLKIKKKILNPNKIIEHVNSKQSEPFWHNIYCNFNFKHVVLKTKNQGSIQKNALKMFFRYI